MHEIKRLAEESTSGREDGQCAHRGSRELGDSENLREQQTAWRSSTFEEAGDVKPDYRFKSDAIAVPRMVSGVCGFCAIMRSRRIPRLILLRTSS
jgi:hypothetical protein